MTIPELKAYLAEVRERESNRTPGKWYTSAKIDNWVIRDADKEINDPEEIDPVVGMWLGDRELRLSNKDAEYIAGASTDIPRLLGIVEALVDEIERTEKQLADLKASAIDGGGFAEELEIEIAPLKRIARGEKP